MKNCIYRSKFGYLRPKNEEDPESRKNVTLGLHKGLGGADCAVYAPQI